MVSNQRIIFKVTKLCDAYVDYRKKNNCNLEKQLLEIFDVTKPDGTWLCSEDKQLYRSQIQSNGTIGYTTTKLAPSSSIHPSKRRRVVDEVAVLADDKDDLPDNNSFSDDADNCANDPDFQANEEYSKRKYQSTKSAAHLVTKCSLSTRQASKVCGILSNEGADLVSTPSQAGVWKRVIKDGKEKKSQIINILQHDTEFCLHFDGKRIMTKEYEVVCLKSPSKTINMGVIVCDSGTAADVFLGLKNLLDEFDAWKNIKMIVCDTTAVNTGKKNGIVISLQREFSRKGFIQPQYIGCQHHVLDLILRHLLDYCFPTQSQKPNLNYEFVEEIISQYETLQMQYVGEATVPAAENPGWRDDFKFLFELCQAYKFCSSSGKFGNIHWRKLPSLHSARWNSRATFALLAYFLLPYYRNQLRNICNFISTVWASAWFSNQHFKEDVYHELLSAVSKFDCQKATTCFKTHWVNQPSVVDVPRSNIVAERAVKVMEDIRARCKTDKYLNLKFLNSNLQL